MKGHSTPDLYDLLQTRIRPILEQCDAELRAEFTNIKSGVYPPVYHPDDSCDIGLECLLKDALPDQPDVVELSVWLSPARMYTERLALVTWDQPGGVEAELLPRRRESIEDVFRELEENLPALCEVLRNAIRRGTPPA